MSALPTAANEQAPPASLTGSTETAEVSFDEFLAMDDEERKGWELVEGHLKERTVGVYESLLAARISHGLMNHVEESGCGGYVLDADTIYRCFETPKTGCKADVSYLAPGRISVQELRTAYLAIPPDLAVEIISPTDRFRALRAKEQQYLRAGVRLLWRVDPDHREVTAIAAGERPRLVNSDESIDGGDVLPGLSLSVGGLFAD